MNEAPYQSIADASKSSGLSVSRIRKWIKEGNIPFIQSGAKYYVKMSGLYEYLETVERRNSFQIATHGGIK